MRFWVSRGFGPFRLGVSFGLPLRRRASNPRFQRSGRGGFVYVIKREGDDHRVKVGSSSNPPQRLKELQTGSADRLYVAWSTPVHADHVAVEREAHVILDRHRGFNEWFSVPTDVAVAAISAASFRVGEAEAQSNYPRRTRLIENGVVAGLAVFVAVGCLVHVSAAEAPVSDATTSGEREIGSWRIYADKDPINDAERALAMTEGADHEWRLTVRCLDGAFGLIVARTDAPSLQSTTLHYRALFRPDHGQVTSLPAQTYSQGGVIILDASAILPAIESGSDLVFRFEGLDNKDQIDAEFKPEQTKEAFAPLRQICHL